LAVVRIGGIKGEAGAQSSSRFIEVSVIARAFP
jgi:hypothetical protein